MPFARYRSTETQVRYFNGAWYLVRYEMYPHTDFSRTPRTMQGHCYLTGVGQGCTPHSGFAYFRYPRKDTEGTYIPYPDTYLD